MRIIKCLTLSIMVLGGPAMARSLPPLELNVRVQQEFLAAAVGDEIRKNCSSISARIVYVLRKAKTLENYALSLGYSKSDIRTMQKDPKAKARLKALRDAYLFDHGVTTGVSESYCALGRREIAQKSLIGSLLRAH